MILMQGAASMDLLSYLKPEDISWLESMGWKCPVGLKPAARVGAPCREARQMYRNQMLAEVLRAKRLGVA